MVDQPVTKEKLINADIDVENLGKAVNELGFVNPRYGNPYKTAPQVIQDLEQKSNQTLIQGQEKVNDLAEAINIALAAGAGAAGWTASLVVDGDKTQKEINRYIVQPFKPDRTYLLNERVQLASGDIVKSTVANNTVDPNLDMAGWVSTSDARQIIDISGLNQQQVNDLKVDKKDVLPTTQTKDSFKNAYSSKKGNQFRALRDSTPCGRAYIWKNPVFTSGTITVAPFTSSNSDITGTCTSGYTIKLAFSNGSHKTTKAIGTTWSIPNSPPLSSADLISSISYDADYRFSLGINQSGWNTVEWDFVADVDDFYRMRYGFAGNIRSPSITMDATNLSQAPIRSLDNSYFRSSDGLNATFDVVFNGSGLLFNHYTDTNGGLFEVRVDGGDPILVSTHSSNPENSIAVAMNVSKLIVNGLASVEHTATFKFIGDDPLYPPASGTSRGWFKLSDGVQPEAFTAYVITGNEMGRKATGAILVSNAILEFAISAKPSGSGFIEDWVPSHGSASGCIVVNSRKIFIDNEILSDTLSAISTERELKEFTMIQDYTAYNPNDTLKTLPMWTGVLITKFNRTDGLTYNHSFTTVNDIDVPDGYTAMCSGQRRDSSGNVLFTKIICDNGYEVDISAPPPAAQINHNSGVLKSAQWVGAKHGLAINVESVESSSALGRPTTDANATLLTERPDRFCKLYFKPMGKNKTIPSGTEFNSIHYVWLAVF